MGPYLPSRPRLGRRRVDRCFTYPMLYYIWGHSYEFERDHTWEQMESLCRRLAGRDDIWYVTNIDYYHYLQAARRLVYSAQGDRVYNPTGIKVWVCDNGLVRTV